MPEAKIYQKPKLVTVFGGSGFVGRYVTEALTKRGYRVRIAVRYPEKAYYMLQIGDVGQTQMLKTDVGREDSVARALEGAAAAVYLPGLFYNQGKNTFRKLHVEGAENTARLAAKAGLGLVHISALSAKLGQKTAYLRSKAQGEERVRAAHKKAIILRPSIIFGAEDAFFNRFANWARFMPVMPLFGGGESKFQPVYVGDVAEMIARAIDGEVKPGRIYELGGLEVLSFRKMMDAALLAIRRRRAFLSVPMPLGAVLGGLCGLAGKIPAVPTIATAGQIRMLGYDSLVSEAALADKRTLAGAGIQPAALDTQLPCYLWRFRVHGQFSQALS